MLLDQAPHQGEADAETSLGSAGSGLRLGEKIEDAGQHVLRDADASVADADDHEAVRRFTVGWAGRCGRIGLIELCRQPNAATMLRVLGCVGQQIAEYLGETKRVSHQCDRGWRQRDGKLVALSVDNRLRGFDGARYDLRQFNALRTQLDFPRHDARQIKQVIHESYQLLHLTFNDIACLFVCRGIGSRHPQQVK